MGRPTILSLLIICCWNLVGAQEDAIKGTRVAPGASCWYPNYYCKFNPTNIRDNTTGAFGYPAETALDCYNDCKSNKTAGGGLACSQFTWINLRGVKTCYLLNDCSEEFRIYDDVCQVRGKCFSGPSDCNDISNTPPCTVPSPMPNPSGNALQWQCEDGQTGVPVNIYDGTNAASIPAGTRCLQSCDSWSINRYASSSQPRGALYSTCEANGTWSNTVPTDYATGGSDLYWPSRSNLSITSYPQPDTTASQLSCACETLTLVWPPSSAMATASGVTMANKFYYNPRDEAGTDFECENEVYNDIVNATSKFAIESSNVCRLFCDNYLVDTVQCIDGKWRGGIDIGMWCYKYPASTRLGTVG